MIINIDFFFIDKLFFIGAKMKKGKIIYLIGGIAFIIAVVSFVFGVIDFISLYKAHGWELQLDSFELYDMIIDLAFAFLELTLGIKLIKQWKEGDSFEIHKIISQLITSIVYASFVQFLFVEIFSAITGGNFLELNVSVIYVIIYLIFGIVIMSTPTLIKKRQLMQLYWVMLISSVLAVGFCCYDVISLFEQSAHIGQIAIGIANGVLTCFIVSFSVVTLIYYLKNPLVLEEDIAKNEDSEVIKITPKYKKVKVYLTRGTNDKINIVIKIFVIISVILGAFGVVSYVIENDLTQYLTGSVGGIISSFVNIFQSMNSTDSMNLLVAFLLIFIYSLLYLSVGISVFTQKGESKIGVISMASIGMIISIFASVSLLLNVFMEFSYTRSINFKNYSLFEIAVMILYVVYALTKKVYSNMVKEVNDGITKRGDSYHSHSKSIARIVLFSGVYSILTFALFFAKYLFDGAVRYSYLLFLLSTLFVIVATNLEVKHPFSEYSIVKRKIKCEE